MRDSTNIQTKRMLRYTGCLLIIMACFSFSGCVVKDVGNVVKHSIKGDFYLSTEDYSKGEESFSKAVKKEPDSAVANYYYGRFLLAEKKYKKALRYLNKATTLNPTESNYHFWTGVAYSGLGQKSREKQSYKEALSLDKDHLQALIYLGHTQLESRRYSAALKNYTKALEIWPTSPTSLYNRALILTKLGRVPEAIDGWLDYLYYYPAGSMARWAVVHLNDLNNFSYRNHQLLTRTVTTGKIYFEPFSATIASETHPSLDLVGEVFSNLNKGKLQIVVYQLNNKELAKQKALNLKRYLLENFKNLKKSDIGVSWFDTAENFKKTRGRKKINDSVVFFVSV